MLLHLDSPPERNLEIGRFRCPTATDITADSEETSRSARTSTRMRMTEAAARLGGDGTGPRFYPTTTLGSSVRRHHAKCGNRNLARHRHNIPCHGDVPPPNTRNGSRNNNRAEHRCNSPCHSSSRRLLPIACNSEHSRNDSPVKHRNDSSCRHDLPPPRPRNPPCRSMCNDRHKLPRDRQ